MSVQTSNTPARMRRCAALVLAMLPLASLSLLAEARPADRPAAALDPAAGSADGSFARSAALRAAAGRPISMDEAVDLAQRRYNARVVRAEVSERGGRRVYLLRLLSADGRVFNVRVDAATGSIQ